RAQDQGAAARSVGEAADRRDRRACEPECRARDRARPDTGIVIEPHQRPKLDDLPQPARERLAEMREHKFFTSDLSVNEFLLVKEAGFQPLGLVMGSSIYSIGAQQFYQQQPGELTALTQALYQSRELAME